MRKLLQTTNDYLPTILRLVLGLVMFPHGAQKVLGWFGGQGFEATMAGMSHNYPSWLVFLALMAEFLGSIGLILGFLTRVASFGIICVMLVAIKDVHGSNGFFMNWMGKQPGEGFEYHLLVLGIGLALLIRGAGALSVDRALAK